MRWSPFGGEHEELEASFRYAVLGTLSSTAILVGVGVVYAVTGTLNMAHIASRVAEVGLNAPPVVRSRALSSAASG